MLLYRVLRVKTQNNEGGNLCEKEVFDESCIHFAGYNDYV